MKPQSRLLVLALAVLPLGLLFAGCASEGQPLAPLRPDAPVLGAASPASVFGGTTVEVTVTGSSFRAETAWTVSWPGVELQGVVFVSATEVRLKLVVSKDAVAGKAVVSATNPGSLTAATGLITVAPPPLPRIDSLTPAPLRTGTTRITIRGANFENGAKMTVGAKDGISWSALTFVSATELTCDVVVTAIAAPGPHDVTIQLLDGRSGTGVGVLVIDASVSFVVTSVFPSLGTPGTTGLTISVGGSGFVAGATVTLSGSGVTIRNTTFVSSGQIDLVIDIAAAAPLGGRDVTVTNPDLSSATGFGVFNVGLPPGPTIFNVLPSAAAVGKTGVVVSVNGANFQAGAAVVFSGAGITVRGVAFVNAGRLDVTIDIAAAAPLGGRDVTATNPDLRFATAAGAFSVVATANPIVSAVAPNAAAVGTTGLLVSLTGANFQSGATVAFSGAGVTVTLVTFVSAGQLNVRIDVAMAAATGARDVTVTNPDLTAGTGVGLFTVNAAPPPSVFSVTPSSANPGTNGLALMVGGASFVAGATVSFSGAGITVVGTTFVSSSRIDVTVNLAAGAAPGARDVSVTNPDLRSGTGIGVFTVNAPAVSYSTQIQPLWDNNCAFTGCHAGAAPQQGMDLSAGVSFTAIVGIVSREAPAKLRIAPGSPSTSYVVEKVELAAPTVGGRMPPGGPFLSAAEIALIKSWVSAGAPNN